MGYTPTQRKYLAAGRCVGCGKERVGDGFTKHRCAICSEKCREMCRKRRARLRAIRESQPKPERPKQDPALYRAKQKAVKAKLYAARKAAGVCVRCGKPTKGRRATPTQCGKCAQDDRARSAAYEQRLRNKKAGYTPGDGRNWKRCPMGAASTGKREGGEYDFTLMLDRPSLAGLVALRQRYRDDETRAGRDWQTHQLSRLVREVILRYEPTRVTVSPRPHLLLNGAVAHLSLDGRTKAILARQAAKSFNGNKSATLRAMLANCQAIRRAFTGRAFNEQQAKQAGSFRQAREPKQAVTFEPAIKSPFALVFENE